MLTTPDSLLQSYRLRMALEPAALLEPGYRLDRAVLQRCRAAEIHLLEGGIAADPADRIHDRGVNFHESLVEASGNVYFIDTIRRVNRVRRLLSYRSMQDRARYREHCEQHLEHPGTAGARAQRRSLPRHARAPRRAPCATWPASAISSVPAQRPRTFAYLLAYPWRTSSTPRRQSR